jgi:hypothetical protein
VLVAYVECDMQCRKLLYNRAYPIVNYQNTLCSIEITVCCLVQVEITSYADSSAWRCDICATQIGKHHQSPTPTQVAPKISSSFDDLHTAINTTYLRHPPKHNAAPHGPSSPKISPNYKPR